VSRSASPLPIRRPQAEARRLSAPVAAILLLAASVIALADAGRHPYEVVDTGQTAFYDDRAEIPEPEAGQPYFGQDAQLERHPPRYSDPGDGTVVDEVTGLVWQKSFLVLTYEEAVQAAERFELAGFDDWRLPSIKELYSLARFDGVDASSRSMDGVPQGAKPFLDPVFDVEYGSNGPRPIDVQLLSSTLYRGTTMGGAATVFGFNVADGRIKGYPIDDPRSRSGKQFTVRFVRGNPSYGANDFHDTGSGTVRDLATGLEWSTADSGSALSWRDALTWVAGKNAENHLGHDDWRLPNAKELQSLVDYDRSPQSTGTAAISPLFEVTTIEDEAGRDAFPCTWSSTTHVTARDGSDAVYLCFGEALGWFPVPGPRGGSPRLLDVHGAGAQRSDPKSGDPDDFPRGRGPQGDVVRILHLVRLVRDL